MRLLHSLALAFSIEDVEDAWRRELAAAFQAFPGVRSWVARWTLRDQPQVSVMVAARPDPFARFIERLPPGEVRHGPAGTPVHALTHPQVPASLFVTGDDAASLADAVASVAEPVVPALALSHTILRAHHVEVAAAMVLAGSSAVFVVDRIGQLLEQSALADALVKDVSSGVSAEGFRLSFRSRQVQALFRARLAAAFETSLPQRFRKDSVAVSIAASGPVATVVIRRLDRSPEVDIADLRSDFGLTPGQAQLAKAIIDGETVDAYAERKRLSRQGVKWHLSPLMRKLGCERREELVAKLIRWAG